MMYRPEFANAIMCQIVDKCPDVSCASFHWLNSCTVCVQIFKGYNFCRQWKPSGFILEDQLLSTIQLHMH